jgi:hypothetical protein
MYLPRLVVEFGRWAMLFEIADGQYGKGSAGITLGLIDS